ILALHVSHTLPLLHSFPTRRSSDLDMLWFILREAGVVFAIGVPIGLALTFAASHFIGALLYEISPLDPRIHFVTVLILLGAGFLASFIPARWALSVDPMVALRYE